MDLYAFLRIPLALESTGKNIDFIEDFKGESLDHVQLCQMPPDLLPRASLLLPTQLPCFPVCPAADLFSLSLSPPEFFLSDAKLFGAHLNLHTHTHYFT